MNLQSSHSSFITVTSLLTVSRPQRSHVHLPSRLTMGPMSHFCNAPVRSDHPAYPYMRDADGDGVVCE